MTRWKDRRPVWSIYGTERGISLAHLKPLFILAPFLSVSFFALMHFLVRLGGFS